MKTKDLIKILKEADPTGEHHVRIEGDGWPTFAHLEDGYWDGPCCYEENGKVIIDYENTKLRLYARNTEDWIGDYFTESKPLRMLPFDKSRFEIRNGNMRRNDHAESVFAGLREQRSPATPSRR